MSQESDHIHLKGMHWLSSALQAMHSRVQHNRPSQGMLITGKPGVGHEVLAHAIVSLRMCQRPLDTGESCGHCKHCSLLQVGTHPDSLWVVPEKKGAAIKVDQIRALAEKLYKKPQVADWRVAVVSPADAMNINAANALLKVLEEPPENCMLLLLSDAPSSLLPTLRSRCQTLNILSPPVTAVKDWLMTQQMSEDDACHLMAATDGSPLKAKQGHHEGLLDDWLEFNDNISRLEQGHLGALTLASLLKQQDMRQLTLWMISRVHAEVAQRAKQNEDYLRLMDYSDFLRSQLYQLDSGGNPNAESFKEQLMLGYEAACKVKTS